MDDTHSPSGPSEADAAKAVSQLGESMAQASESHRALVQEITLFAKDEGLRFVNLRLERNGAALDKLQNCHGLLGLIGVQQEWLRNFLQDYASQNLRVAGAFRGLAHNAMTSAAETTSEHIDRMQHQADDMVHNGGEQMSQMDTNIYVQDPIH